MLLLGLLLGGGVFTAPPSVAPGSPVLAPTPSMEAGVEAHKRGDDALAVLELERWLGTKKGATGRPRAAARFLLGWIHFEAGRYNQASAQFTQVRTGGGPLAPWAAWYEAVADLRRGRADAAAVECGRYREKWPEGKHFNDCLALQGHAWLAAGKGSAARKAFEEYLALDPENPRAEEIRLGIARARALENPAAGAAALQDLVYHHDNHCTGAAAEAALASLGVKPAQLDEVTREELQALEKRDCGFQQEAWELYTHIGTEHADAPGVAQWSASNFERMGWRTHQYEELGRAFGEAYARNGSSDSAWYAFRAYFRGGMWPEAARWGRIGLEKFRGTGQWRGEDDTIAHALVLAGQFREARTLWDELAAGRGTVAKDARWFAAHSAWMAKDLDDALSRFTALESDPDRTLGAMYFKGKVLWAKGQKSEARAIWAEIVKREPHNWYALLVNSDGKTIAPGPQQRQGRWTGAPPAPAPATPKAAPVAAPSPGVLAVDKGPSSTVRASGATARVTDVAVAPAAAGDTWTLPPTYVPGRFYDPAAIDAAFESFADAADELWPDMPAMLDMGRVGVWSITGPFLAEAYEEWEDASRRRTTREVQLRALTLEKTEWRQLFLFAQDHHHVARFTLGLANYTGGDTEEWLKAMRLAWPAAWGEDVMQRSREYDVDPLLVLGLMRRESLYRSTALSHAGAVGVMQVMPGTGGKVAWMLGEPEYTPDVLQDPHTNVKYGTFYLGRLLTRFEGAWPLAVAAYNAGPVHVSSWTRAWVGKIGIDDWAEMIPLEEPRRYVKYVAENYSTYTALYGPAGARVHVPPAPAADHPGIVNF